MPQQLNSNYNEMQISTLSNTIQYEPVPMLYNVNHYWFVIQMPTIMKYHVNYCEMQMSTNIHRMSTTM
jgi:hypothetical protein